MREMMLTPLTEKDRKNNEYLDHVNHAPYVTIFFTILVMLLVFTMSVSLGAF